MEIYEFEETGEASACGQRRTQLLACHSPQAATLNADNHGIYISVRFMTGIITFWTELQRKTISVSSVEHWCNYQTRYCSSEVRKWRVWSLLQLFGVEKQLLLIEKNPYEVHDLISFSMLTCLWALVLWWTCPGNGAVDRTGAVQEGGVSTNDRRKPRVNRKGPRCVSRSRPSSEEDLVELPPHYF